MRATEELRNDHGVLRAKLTLLEELVPLAPDPQGLFRALASAVARCVSCHTEKEELLLALLQERLPQTTRATIQPLLNQHRRYASLLTAIHDLLAKEDGSSIEQATRDVSELIIGLRDHMAKEEETLFPDLDRLLGLEQAEEATRLMHQMARCYFLEETRTPHTALSPITEEMTVNHVLRAHPMTREVLTAFGVDCELDGCNCVGDLSWRRGLDVEALLLSLNQSLGHGPSAVPVPWVLWESCDGMMVIDSSRRVLAMNPALERLIGQRSQDVVGRSECGVLFACQDRHGCALSDHPEACPGLRAMHRLRTVKETEYTIRTAEGKRIPIGASYTPIQLGPSGPIWALVVMRDIKLQKRRERHMVRQAAMDPLTGLSNRAMFFDALARELRRTVRAGRPLAVAMVDLDGLKAYNDTYGHLAGDALLKAAAALLPTGLRAAELVARYGGDEFALLLPETDARGALTVAKRLCQAVSQFPFIRAEALSGSPHPTPITVSIGLAAFPDDGNTVEALMGQADRRLYEAKERGRGQVVGPERLLERRRKPRVAMEAPLIVHRLTEEPREAWPAACTTNLSMAGVYFTVRHRTPVMIDELLALSVPIPPERQGDFPVTCLTGHGRVVRTEELARAGASGETQFGIAVEFTEDVGIVPPR